MVSHEQNTVMIGHCYHSVLSPTLDTEVSSIIFFNTSVYFIEVELGQN